MDGDTRGVVVYVMDGTTGETLLRIPNPDPIGPRWGSRHLAGVELLVWLVSWAVTLN